MCGGWFRSGAGGGGVSVVLVLAVVAACVAERVWGRQGSMWRGAGGRMGVKVLAGFGVMS